MNTTIRRKAKVRALLAAGGAALLAGCSAAGLAVPGDAADACPQPPRDTHVLADEPNGFCLHYPDGYEVQQTGSDETVIFVESLLNVEQPRASVSVYDANGRTAAQVTDDWLDEMGFVPPDFEVARGETTLGGEEAVVLDGVPGQDISRQVIVVHGGTVYHLAFVPPGAEMESLYALVAGSFTFVD